MGAFLSNPNPLPSWRGGHEWGMTDHAAAEAHVGGVGRIAIIASAIGLVRVEFLADASPTVKTSGDGAAAGMRDHALRVCPITKDFSRTLDPVWLLSLWL